MSEASTTLTAAPASSSETAGVPAGAGGASRTRARGNCPNGPSPSALAYRRARRARRIWRCVPPRRRGEAPAAWSLADPACPREGLSSVPGLSGRERRRNERTERRAPFLAGLHPPAEVLDVSCEDGELPRRCRSRTYAPVELPAFFSVHAPSLGTRSHLVSMFLGRRPAADVRRAGPVSKVGPRRRRSRAGYAPEAPVPSM